jgi:SAM-dependent methyltransferase
MGQYETPTESLAMRVAGLLGLKKLRWSLRRLHCPTPKQALVLEVGAGGNPYPRANVLLDAMETTIERNEQQLINDRPLVLGLCEELPFKDKSFDYVIASHVHEHTDDPEKFLSELMRVAKAGYIETPEGWFEKMCSFTYHRLEVSNVGGKLFIRKKQSWKPDEIALLYDNKLANNEALASFLRVNPDLNHMRFFWNDHIEYEIVNPDVDASWPYPEEALERTVAVSHSPITKIRNLYLSVRRWTYSQGRRNKRLDVKHLLRCPTCHSEDLTINEKAIHCTTCFAHYEVCNGIPKLFPLSIDGFNRSRMEVQ